MKALQKLLILGSGKMGGSLLKGLTSNNEFIELDDVDNEFEEVDGEEE